jgi:hypothetical protein
MALDLAIVGPDGSPERSVGIRADEHERILAVATTTKARLLLRLKDFYADADYAPSEVAELRDEAIVIREALKSDSDCAVVIERTVDLLDQALREKRGISAIAD